ncbi:MAG: hypothetical protein IIW77_04675 [Bacteroidaceae bacterium]|nr:hypothetical protein [Bacteroidaceae bacterium]
MRIIIVVTIALFLSTGAACTTFGTTLKENVAVDGNIIDKLIALINEYAGKADDAVDMEELNAVYQAFKQEMAEFTKKNADGIAAFDTDFSTQQQEEYKTALDTAVRLFQKSLEKKAMQFLR